MFILKAFADVEVLPVLTLSQMAYFLTLPKPKSLQMTFSNLMKMAESSGTGRKHCGKRRNCSLQAISPFPTVFSKDLYCRHVKTRACFWKGLTLPETSLGSDMSAVHIVLKTLGEKEKILVTSKFSFSHSVFYSFGELPAIFIQFEIIVYKLFSVLESLKFVVLERDNLFKLNLYQTTKLYMNPNWNICRQQNEFE